MTIVSLAQTFATMMVSQLLTDSVDSRNVQHAPSRPFLMGIEFLPWRWEICLEQPQSRARHGDRVLMLKFCGALHGLEHITSHLTAAGILGFGVHKVFYARGAP
jgi:hypothetical protein